MSLEPSLRYESNGFGYPHHNQFMSPESYGRQYHGNFMESSINKLYSQVEAHDNQRFSSHDLHPQNFGDAFLGAENAGTTLQSLMESFGSFDLEQPQQPSYNGWPAPAPQMSAPAPMIQPQMSAPAPMIQPDLGTKSPMKFPSQMLTQNSRASPFSDTTESSLFSSCSNLSRLDLPSTSTFSNFSTSSLMSSQSSGGKIENSLGLSDISSRLEGLSQGSLIMSQTCSTRDSTPLSWNPIANFSSKTNSLTSSPIMSGHKNITRPDPPALFSDEEEDNLTKVIKNTSPPHVMPHDKIRNLAKPKLHKSMSTSCVPEPAPGPSGPASWSQIVRTSSSKLPQAPPAPVTSPLSSPRVTRASLNTPSPSPVVKEEPRLVVEEVPPTTNTVDFHRGPKVDPRWPVSQQVFLGPIPMSITWDEIRNVFYTKVQRRELLHFYVQSKPVNEVVYGQVVFDKVSLAAKVVKDGPVKVRGHLINVTLMKEKVKAEKKK